LDETTATWLVDAYVRRKRWEFDQQAIAVLNAYGDALTGKGQPRPTTPAAATPGTPARGGLERSRSGKVFERVSAAQLLHVVEARVLPPQG
jgi:hypothetical protein